MPDCNFVNRTLYHGDNLDFLRGLNSGTVNLIATDPPFNKSRDFHATPDSLAKGARFVDRWRWDRDVHQEWVDSIKDDWPGVWQAIENGRVNHSEGMAAFLCWLGIRLIEMRRVLADAGSIYLHIDHTAHAYAKSLMDAIFDRRNFRNEIVWCYRTGGASKRTFAKKHDTILFYSKSDNYRFTLPLAKSRLTGQLRHSANNETGTDEWGVYQNIRFSSTRIKLYRDDGGYYTLTGCRDYWNIDAVGRTGKERTGYPTQKPLALYERIIQASSNPGDLVLDPFCGCATTPVAAERLGRQWIGMDIWDGAADVVRRRMADSRQLLSDSNPAVTYTATPPERTDDRDAAPTPPDLRLRVQRGRERWERLTHAEMRDILADAQASGENVICAGCGIALPVRYMQLDHREPRQDGGENAITNRILLCAPCNNTKRASLTLTGLIGRNRQDGFMVNQELATLAASKAGDAARRCRAEMR